MVSLSSSPALGPPRWLVATIAACVILLLYLNIGGVQKTSFNTSIWRSSNQILDAPHVMSDIQNSTLGFEKIFVINLPERTDKRDAFSLAASLTNFSVDYVDGVKGETVVNQSLPNGQEHWQGGRATLGSWRAHMNAIRNVVEKRISSALILEDDADWDIHLKSQLNDFAHGTRFLQNQTPRDQTISPYGDGWDVLWLGHCHDDMDELDRRTYVIQDDPTVPAVSQLVLNNPDFLQQWPPHSRVVHVVGRPICTFGYAISYKGAQKILYSLSVKELRGLFDNALSWWCTDKAQNARCLDAHPSYFSQHRAIGGPMKNSDNSPGLMQYQTKAETKNIRFSTRLNLENLIVGNTDYYDSYPRDQALPSNQADVVTWS